MHTLVAERASSLRVEDKRTVDESLDGLVVMLRTRLIDFRGGSEISVETQKNPQGLKVYPIP